MTSYTYPEFLKDFNILDSKAVKYAFHHWPDSDLDQDIIMASLLEEYKEKPKTMHLHPPDYFNVHCIANIKAMNFKTLDKPGKGRKRVLRVSDLVSVLTELIRLNTKAVVSVKLLWRLKSPKQKAVTSHGILDVRHQKRLVPGAEFEISGFFFHQEEIILVLQNKAANLFRTPTLEPVVNTFCMTYAIQKQHIQHIKVCLSDRCAIFVADQSSCQTVEEWTTQNNEREIFHIQAAERVQSIRDNLNPPSPKMYGGSIVDQLNRLSILHREGELTDMEFSKAKKMLF